MSIKKVRAVSMGERIRADNDEEMNERINVARGDGAVRISAASDEAISSSGNPTIADKRLRIKVFNVGKSSE